MEYLEEIAPPELLKIVETGEFEDDGGLLITGLEYIANDLKVKFLVDPGYLEIDGKKDQLWELQIGNLKRVKLEISWNSEIGLYSDHFLMWDFTKSWTDLYFNGKAKSPDKLLSDIYQIHNKRFGSWIGVENYLNAERDLYYLCNSQFGLFAKGPKEILEVYEGCLSSHNMNPHFLGDSKGPYSENSETPLRLLMLGESYFIGETFKLTRA